MADNDNCGGKTIIPETLSATIGGKTALYVWDSCEQVWRISEPTEGFPLTIQVKPSEPTP